MKKDIIYLIITLLILVISFFIGCGKKEETPAGTPLPKPSDWIMVRHILVEKKETAEEISARLKKGEDFEKLAKEYSMCPSRVNGGKIEPFVKGTKDKEFEDAAFSLKIGKIGDPIETSLGWEIIQRLEVPPTETPTPTLTPTPIPPIRVRHILFLGTEEEGNKLIQKLKKGEDFTKAALEFSNCPSRAKGGDLGMVEKGQMFKELDEVAFKLKVGEMYDKVIKTKFGWHIIQRIDPNMVIELPEMEEIRIRNIVVMKEEQAKVLIEELKKGGDFTKLAIQFSSDVTKDVGGDLGVIGVGVLPLNLEKIAYSLEEGELYEKPIQAEYGWYIMQRLPLDYEIELPPKQIRVSDILVETREEAEEIIKELEKGKKFAELAKEKSISDASKNKGGDIGIIKKGTMVRKFEDVAFSLEVGQISEPVETQDGWHIILRTK